MFRRKITIAFIYFLIVVSLVSCDATSTKTQRYSTIDYGYKIGEVFTPLVNALGELRSPAITEVFSRNGVFYQYTLAYLMVYNPVAPVGQQYRLFPLGKDLKISQPPAQIAQDGDLVVDGYVIWQDLTRIYRLYGATLIGPPITELLYNTEVNRYEQYFTNMAFYRYADSADGDIGFMPYGAWYCNTVCTAAYDSILRDFASLPPEDRILSGKQTQAEVTFKSYASKLGLDFTGAPLSDVQYNADGQYIQIFENVVMMIDPHFLNEVKFLDLPAQVGVIPDEPEPPSESSDFVFYPIRMDLGFNIPKDFFDFITLHGTFDVSGPPIQRAYTLDNNGVAQCFEHICLEYRPNTLSNSQVRVLPLGRDYFQKITGISPGIPEQSSAAPMTLNVKVWERFPLLPPNQSQEIGVAVFEGSRPLSHIDFYVTLLLPNGSQRVNFLNPTGSDGQTHITLDPIDLPKGTMVPYQVCVAGVTENAVCLNESFLIWEEE